MQALLIAKDLWGYASGAVTKEGVTDAAASKTYYSTSQIVCALIYLNIDPEMEAFIVDKLDSMDAPGMWKALEDECLSKHPGAHFNAFDDFFSIRKQEDESLTLLAVRVAESIHYVCNLRPKVYTLENMEEELECMALIRALPEEFNAFSSSLLMVDDL